MFNIFLASGHESGRLFKMQSMGVYMHVFMNAFEFMIELLDGKVLDDSSVFTASWPLHAVFCNTRVIFAKHYHQSGAATKNPRLVSVSMVSHIASILHFFFLV